MTTRAPHVLHIIHYILCTKCYALRFTYYMLNVVHFIFLFYIRNMYIHICICISCIRLYVYCKRSLRRFLSFCLQGPLTEQPWSGLSDLWLSASHSLTNSGSAPVGYLSRQLGTQGGFVSSSCFQVRVVITTKQLDIFAAFC